MEISSTTDKHVILDLGKIDYNGQGRKTNKADVYIGFTNLRGESEESYFSVAGYIWNESHTHILRGGSDTAKFLLEEFFPHNATLRKVCQFSARWHLLNFSEIPEKDRNEIIELMEEIEDFNGDIRNL